MVFAAIHPQGRRPGVWALPKGLIDAGERAEQTALREVEEETGARGRPLGKLGDVRYVYTSWGRGERVFKVVSFFLVRYSGGPARRDRRGDAARGGRGPLAAARRGGAAARLQGRTRDGREGPGYDPAAVPAYALNFYSPVVADQLRSHRKTATIRLGDKSRKYHKGMIVTVLAGARFGPRERIFDAVIDKVEVKR